MALAAARAFDCGRRVPLFAQETAQSRAAPVLELSKTLERFTKTSYSKKQERGLTLIEVFVLILVSGFFAAMVLPAFSKMKAHDQRIACVNNLKQVGLAFRIWEGDHADKYPMSIAETNGGTMDFLTGSNAFRHFQVTSNQLFTPQILFCPAESDRSRFPSTNFARLSNSNLSYFVGLDANESDPQYILSGDHNLTNGTSVKNGILELTPNAPVGWTAKMHRRIGNIVLADGSVQQTSATGLRTAITYATLLTNHLQMPILGP